MTGVPSAERSYPMILNPNDVLPPGGTRLAWDQSVKVTKAELIFDPSIVASASTIFKLQNHATSPTSTGTVTVAAGSNVGESTTLAVKVMAGQRLFIKCPSALHDLQNLYIINLQYEVI